MGWMQRLGAVLGMQVKLVKGGDSVPYVASYQDGRPIVTPWSAEKAVEEGLKASSWVYSACSKISTGLASVPLRLEQLQGEEWKPAPTHPIQDLLNRPNPYMSRQDVQERWALHMLLAGNALWFKNLVNGVPVELWPLMPDHIKPKPSRLDFLAGYEWRPSPAERIQLDPDQVTHWMFVDPANQYWGMPPIMAAARAVDTDIEASRWNRAVLANDGKPPYAVLLNEGLSITQQREATALMREQLDGNNVRRMLALGAARDIKTMAMSASDMDWLNGRRFSREEIGAVMGVPPILMAFGEAATFANLDAAKALLWEDRIVPLLDDLCQGLTMSLFPHWNLKESQWRIRPDLSNVRALQANLKTEAQVRLLQAQQLSVLVAAGVPINMAARYLGMQLEPIDGGDAPRAVSATPPEPTPNTKSREGPRFERKDKQVDQRLGRIDDWTAEAQKKVAALLKAQGKTLASAYLDGMLDQATDLSIDDWQALLEAVHTAVLESEGPVAYTGLLQSLKTTNTGGSFDVLDPAVQAYISDHAGEAAKGLTETTKAGLQLVLSKGVEDGVSESEMADRIQAQFADWSDARAQLVARTEVGTAFGASHQLSAEQAAATGLELVKTWRSAGDARVRPEHVAMDGETVGLGQSFSNGLDFPAEPNCRCVVTYDEKG